MIELGKTYKNTAGRSVRIICVDRVSDTYPAIGLIAIEPIGTEAVCSYSMDGKAQPGHYDLIVPERYVKLEDVLKLYLVAHDDGADNWDLYVWAHSPEEARELWFNAWEYEQMPDDVRVFEIPTAPASKPQVLEWLSQVKKVA